MTDLLTPRYYPLRPHPIQSALWNSPARFRVVPAGRRSGKTERAKRYLIRKALTETEWPDANFFAAAPTRDQAKRIYWDDLKKMVPKWMMSRQPSESELTIYLVTGARISVIGMDKPERIEGSPWNGGVLDEYANMKAKAWGENIRPALSDRKGWCWIVGVPEGRNHYYDMFERASSGADPEWAAFTWKSADILPAEEIEAAKRELDELVFQQEYEASFLNFQGRAYYTFDRNVHCHKVEYNPALPLNICFDFNVSPGVAVICQEQRLPHGVAGTAVVGEVYVPANSNTIVVCNRIIRDWGHHQGEVWCFGDATGGAGGSAKVLGSDWELIARTLRGHWNRGQVKFSVPAANPEERTRVNSVNTRFRTADGLVHCMVNPEKAKNLVRDLEGVRVVEGGSGEIDKKSDKKLTHISDAFGYYVVRRFPVHDRGVISTDVRI